MRESDLQPGAAMPALLRQPSTYDVAWLAMFPTTAPALTTEEHSRITRIRDGATDPRVKARAQAVLTADGAP